MRTSTWISKMKRKRERKKSNKKNYYYFILFFFTNSFIVILHQWIDIRFPIVGMIHCHVSKIRACKVMQIDCSLIAHQRCRVCETWLNERRSLISPALSINWLTPPLRSADWSLLFVSQEKRLIWCNWIIQFQMIVWSCASVIKPPLSHWIGCSSMRYGNCIHTIHYFVSPKDNWLFRQP